MTNFSTLNKVPNPFQPENLERAWKFFREPVGLAVLASLGVHGLLWFGLPLLSSPTPDPADAQKSVGVLELSPLEQARLPQTSMAQPFSPLPKTSKSKLSNPLTSGIPLTPPIPSTVEAMPYYNIPGISLPYGVSTILPKRWPEAKLRPVPPKPKTQKPEKTDRTESSTGTPDNSGEKPGDGKPNETATENPSTRASDLKPLAGEEGKNPDGTEKKPLTLAQLYAYNASGTSDQDFVTNANAFSQLATDKLKTDIIDWEKPTPITVPYPKEACPFKTSKGEPIKGEPWVGAIAKPDGKLAAKPLLLRSSGFRGLDEAALDYVLNQKKFDTSKQYKGYYFPVKFEPPTPECISTEPKQPDS